MPADEIDGPPEVFAVEGEVAPLLLVERGGVFCLTQAEKFL